MRTALVYPHTKRSTHQCTPPLALLYLATNLRREGVEVQVFDVDGYRDRTELLDEVARFRPELVGMPSFSEISLQRGLQAALVGLCEKLPKATVVIGGPHATACPRETLTSFPQADFVLRGEADYTLGELIAELEGNAAHPSVSGLCYRNEGGLVEVPLEKPPQDLDAIPIPDRGFIRENYRRNVYRRLGRKPPADMLITSRGCPFSCRFCFKVERGYRVRSAENVVQELIELASMGISTIDLEDDLFTAKKSRCLEVCRLIREAGLKLDLKVRSHVRTIDEETLAALKSAGVRVVVYGIESGSDLVLKAMGKKATVEDNYRAIRLTKRAGLLCYADVFVGFPGETPDTIEETRRFLRKARPTAVNMGVLVPYPGTPVYEEAKENGTLTGDWSVDGPQPFVQLPWADRPAVLWKQASRMLRSFYSHPAVAFSLARNVAFRMDANGWRSAARYASEWFRK
jgi:anaerobic magnesium-protoporphyrin IX monomethyl ester cyclase